MKYCFKITILLSNLCVFGNVAATTTSCPETDDSFACQQRRAMNETWVYMNQSTSEMIDTIIEEPGKAIDMGCLDRLSQIDLNIFTIDPRAIWGDLTAGIMDTIRDFACTAIEDKYNEYAERLNVTLEAPLGLGSVELGTSGFVDDSDDFTETRVRLSNEEARSKVIQEVLGEYPSPYRSRNAERELDQLRIDAEGTSDRQRVDKDEESIKRVFDINSLFRAKTPTESEEEADEGN